MSADVLILRPRISPEESALVARRFMRRMTLHVSHASQREIEAAQERLAAAEAWHARCWEGWDDDVTYGI